MLSWPWISSPSEADVCTRCGIADGLFLSLGEPDVAAVRDVLIQLSPSVTGVELRLDRLKPEVLAEASWLLLPGAFPREWIATWRSEAEGGRGGPRPAGLYSRALEAGYRWVDVEARALDEGDIEARKVPAERRWVSAHPPQAPGGPPDIRRAWDDVVRHPAALHKLAVDADRFLINTWVCDLDRSLGPTEARQRALFARGWIGHPSRIAGYLSGQGASFVALEESAATAAGQPSLDLALRIYGLDRGQGPAGLYGILGGRVRGSRSPEIHNHAFRTLGHSGLYIVLEAEAAEPVLGWIREDRLAGVSVTAPFKEDVASQVDFLEPDAERIGAVNTVWKQDGKLRGANTDVEAAREILGEMALAPGSPVAVLGSGGSAKAILLALEEGNLRATVFNRNRERGQVAAARFGARWGGEPETCDPGEFRAVVNTIPAGPDFPGLASRWRREIALLDLVYAEPPSPWIATARAQGGVYRSGLEFLLRQAAGPLERWTGTRPSPALLAAGLCATGEIPER